MFGVVVTAGHFHVRSINDHGYCAENILDTMVARNVNIDVVDECGR